MQDPEQLQKSGRPQQSGRLQKWSWRGIWILPVALSIDNLTFGAVTG
jgi:hypothetical protein